MSRGKAPSPDAEPRPEYAYTREGGGVVTRCTACGWERFEVSAHEAEQASLGHTKCRNDDVKLHARLARSRIKPRARRR